MLLNSDSWRRISSASMPPSMKNTNVVTRYMIPIFLWSVVTTQSIQRLVWRGAVTARESTWGAGLAAGNVVTDMRGLLEVSVLGQIRAQLGHLRVGGLDVLLLLGEPALIRARREHVHERRHERMLAPAQLGTLAVIDDRMAGRARLGDLEPGVGRV